MAAAAGREAEVGAGAAGGSSSDGGGGGGGGSMREELSNLSFEELQELQSKVGLKAYNRMVCDSGKEQRKERRQSLKKDRPMEMSSKQPVPFLRRPVAVKKGMLRDPRFDDLSGDYNPEIFDKTYAFLDDIRHKEKELIKRKLRKVKKPKSKQQLEYVLRRMTEQDKAQDHKRQQRERLNQFKQEQRQRVQQGSKPYFLKKSELKTMELADRYQALKRDGKLESFLGRKRKRNATKDRQKLPGRRAR
ncbi:ribosomal RNA processing protein 36 homolog isoform X1 [Leucoraja erinacea]|uniref:ribosomal RNA processing protein 36 homolog isoform X1 n=1 Tax=Leucoraja erinaceus TaxID=7782 RepID=UPI002454B7EE|nr:ribosomal RNA processing protein 36 homolog isoform X1 [Leucoraja erinacea]